MPLVSLITLLLAAPAAALAADAPNIVLVLADDLGWRDVGFHGAEWPTPNIDRIAREGVELDRFYGTPICTPTRAGLLTGRYPIRFGLQRITVKAWGTRSIPDDETLIPAVLADAGYRIRAITGKWHLGWLRRSNHPLSKGFTSFYGHGGGAIGYFSHEQLGMLDWHRDWDLNYDKGYSTELIGAEAVRVIEQAAREPAPFFLYVAFNAIHTPNDVLERHYERFAQIHNQRRREKAAMVASLDEQVGAILDALERTGQARNTFLLFSSDNGGAIPSGSINEPLRDGKWAVYEGGIRLAAAVRWPEGLKGGRKLTEPISYIDVFPTLVRIAAAKPPAKPFDGQDALDVLRGEKRRDDWVFHSYFQGQRIPQNEDPTRKVRFERNAVNTRQWKLVRLGPDIRQVDDPRRDADLELYRIDRDPYERHDVAADHPAIVAELLEKMTAFRRLQKKKLDPVTVRPPADWKRPASWKIPDQ